MIPPDIRPQTEKIMKIKTSTCDFHKTGYIDLIKTGGTLANFTSTAEHIR